MQRARPRLSRGARPARPAARQPSGDHRVHRGRARPALAAHPDRPSGLRAPRRRGRRDRPLRRSPGRHPYRGGLPDAGGGAGGRDVAGDGPRRAGAGHSRSCRSRALRDGPPPRAHGAPGARGGGGAPLLARSARGRLRPRGPSPATLWPRRRRDARPLRPSRHDRHRERAPPRAGGVARRTPADPRSRREHHHCGPGARRGAPAHGGRHPRAARLPERGHPPARPEDPGTLVIRALGGTTGITSSRESDCP